MTVMSLALGLVSGPLVKSHIQDIEPSVRKATKVNTGKNRGSVSVSRYVWRAQRSDLKWASDHSRECGKLLDKKNAQSGRKVRFG